MKYKKIIAAFLAAMLIISSVSVGAFTIEQDEYDIENLTWDDIDKMDSKEFKKLLNQFERDYDPFGTYETAPLTEDSGNNGIQPLWTSGKEDMSETGSHESITATACGILYRDKGFWGTTENGSIIIALILSLASIIPDKNSGLGPAQAFAGHFYNPSNEKNFEDQIDNTAKTNAKDFYYQAAGYYWLNSSDEGYFESLGKMLHYVQDACEPHHAANIISTGPLSSHSAFEKDVEENLDAYLDATGPIESAKYTKALNTPIENIIYNAAVEAKKESQNVDSTFSRGEWPRVGRITVQNAVTQTAVVLYKFSLELNIPLNK